MTALMVGVGVVRTEEYNNEWSAHIPGGVEHAKKVAEDTGCEYVREIIPGQFFCLLYTSPSPRDGLLSRMPSSA